MKKNKKYPAYKDSGIEWIGEIPEHWEVRRSKYLWEEANLRSKEGVGQLLSVSQYKGVCIANGESRSESLVDYKIVKKNNLVINIMLAWLGGLGVSLYDGIVSPSYAVYKSLLKVDYSYFHYLYRTSFYLDEFTKKSTGVVPSRWRLYSDSFGEVQTILPPLSEQKKIASFLDKKTVEIDKAIELKQKENELLKEHRQVAINRAVTRGLNPNVTYKDSGIEWIGEIPEHWEVLKLKYIFDAINERSKTGKEELLSVSEHKGVLPRKNINVNMFKAESYVNYKVCSPNDLVINSLWAWSRGLGISKYHGIVSTAYSVFRPNLNAADACFLNYVLRTERFVDQYFISSKGIWISRLQLSDWNFLQIPFPLPPLSEQKEIAEYLEELDEKTNRLLDLNNRAIDKLKEYKQVLIDQAVRGQICLV